MLRGLAVLLAVATLFASAPSGAAAAGRLVLAFYYPWYDHNTWNDPKVPDHPPERYTSTDPNVMARQIDQAKGANIDAFVSAWYGPSTQFNQTETNLSTLLSLAGQKGFSAGVQFETSGPFFGGAGDVQNALSALLSTHARSPAYLRWNGKPVIFFWAQNRYSRATWQSIRAQVDPNHASLWIAEGFDMSLQGVFDGGYLYNIAWAGDVGATEQQWAGRVRGAGGQWVGTVMPGWDDTRLVERAGRYARSREGGAWYARTWSGAASANPDWIVITSWNEFVENTYVEPSANMGTQYLDLMRALAAGWKAGGPVSAPQPVSQSVAPAAPAVPAPASVPTRTPPQPAPLRLPAAVAWAVPARPLECSDSFREFCLVR